jgi:hypothetical protein
MTILFWVLAVINVANGLWMLATPAGWFTGVPAAVPDTGPLNEHFVRDVGVAYTVCGIGLAWCAQNLGRALPVLVGVAAFNVGHALTHVADILSGRLSASHWLIDTPGVFAPTILLVMLAFVLAKNEAARA